MDYTIKANDNLTNIAKANNTDVATLAKLNNIQNPNLIQTGATLKLPNALTATNPATSNVPAPNLNNVNQLQLPQTPVQTTPTIPLSMADKAVQDTQVKLTDAQKVQESLISDQMKSILGMNALGTEAQAKQEELVKQGYQQKLQEYNTLNSQILQKQAELAQDDIKLIAGMRAEERRDTLLPFAQMGQAKLQGDAAIMRALKTSEIGVLNAQVLAKQGDIALAQQMAQDAVDAKFAPYKQQIQTYSDLLKSLDPILTRDEKKQANEQQLRGQIALKEIDKLSKFQSDALSAAISNNAPQSVIDKINKAQTVGDISKVGSQWIVSKADKLEQQLKGLQIAKAKSELSTLSPTSPINQKVDATVTLKNLISDLSSMKGQKGAVGAGVQKFIPGFLKGGSQFIAGTPAANYQATYNQLKDSLAFENIGKLKGAMSDKDIEFLRNTATKLSLGMTETAFNNELKKLDETMNKVLIQNGIDPTQVNSYSSLSNDELLNAPLGETSNSNFFNR